MIDPNPHRPHSCEELANKLDGLMSIMFDYIERHHAFDTFQVRHFAIDRSTNQSGPAPYIGRAAAHAVRPSNPRCGLSTERAPVRVRAAGWSSAGTHIAQR